MTRLDERFERPPLPDGFDDSRAHARRRDPAGWAFTPAERDAVWRAIRERRDIRRFRPDPIPDQLLTRLLEAAHQAPSVGLMQPWRFLIVHDEQTKAAMHALAQRERFVQAERFDERTRQFLDLKIEGIRDAPVSVCVCCDRSAGGQEVLGRHTIPDTDLYSTCLAIENLWLTARAEGVGVGWVSFYRPADVQQLLALPEHVIPVAWLCLGYPDERPTRPGLEAAGWEQRHPLDQVIYHERWAARDDPVPVKARTAAQPARAAQLPQWLQPLIDAVQPGDPAAAIAVRDASDELVKPAGSLGALETLLERWATATGAPPSTDPRVAILVLAADHGVTTNLVSLYPSRVSSQVAAAAARGETAIGVLAHSLGARLLVADLGLTGPRPAGVLDARIAAGSADIAHGPALTAKQLRAAIEAGHQLSTTLAADCDLLTVGEIGIGNTTVSSALLAALTGLPPADVCGRGTGLDSQGLQRKRDTVAAALAANNPDPADPLQCLRRLGGLELAGLVGAILAAAAARRPILLDGFATGVAALTAYRLQPATRDYLIAGHRSAEPAHQQILVELGLEPLLDLRLRLGEASGAALALPLINLAARLHHQMRRFDQAGVDRPHP